jgi:hypothetical protein
MNHAPLPRGVWEELGKPMAGLGDDGPHAGEPTPLEMLQKED